MIYVSTLAIKSDPSDFFKEFLWSDYGIEFSSGGLPPDEKKNTDYFIQYDGKKIVHNYFPGYIQNPFVLNLASMDIATRSRSIEHAKKQIKLTAEYSTQKFYGIHAGFCYELEVSDLGKKIENINVTNKDKYLEIFLESVGIINSYAKLHGVKLLLENNVLINENFKSNIIPFFCTESTGILSIFNQIKDNNVGLLLDTAHLKVSCNTLGLSVFKEFEKIQHLVRGIHHSDNDGKYDTNSLLNSNYWFLDFIKDFKDYPNVIEVKNISIREIYNQINLISS